MENFISEIKQFEYMKRIADEQYQIFLNEGHATAGNNGPHGHIDSPVRNTAHYLVIYTYLYKVSNEIKYLEICEIFAKYLCNKQAESKSGAIECMMTDKFDHLNGLIGQAWVVEALLYYYDLTRSTLLLETAKKIFYAQQYDYKLHLWHRIELNGDDIGIDPTYNHNIWFAACASKILDYEDDEQLRSIITDILTKGAERDFRIYRNGLLRHTVLHAEKKGVVVKAKKIIKAVLYHFRKFPGLDKINVRKLDTAYMEKAYHIFDMYGFCILEDKFGELPIFSSNDYQKAKTYALDIQKYNNSCYVEDALSDPNGAGFNVFSYSYNSPAFEYPYVAQCLGGDDRDLLEKLYDIQVKLMYDESKKDFIRNNPDIYTFHAKTYEIIRYLDFQEKVGEARNR